MNIREFRAEICKAFQEEGFREQRLTKGEDKVWLLPSLEVVPYFATHTQRRPFGFVLYGVFGIEIPMLREWLIKYKPGQGSGIFHRGFVEYYSSNDKIFRDFIIESGLQVPADLWIGLIKDRLNLIPSSLDELLRVYRANRELLGMLAHPTNKPAWDFLIRWHQDPDPALDVPRSLLDGPTS